MSTFFERAGLGAVHGNTASPASLGFLSGTGVLNGANASTTAFLAIRGDAAKGNKQRRCKIMVITTGRYMAWGIAPIGGATVAFKADADGSADEGTLVTNPEWVSIPATHDLYLVASAASTAFQVTCFEV